MTCFSTSNFRIDSTSLFYLLMILINVVILGFVALTTESFENNLGEYHAHMNSIQ